MIRVFLMMVLLPTSLSAAEPVIVIHGGAGVRPRAEMTAEQEAEYRAVLADSLRTGSAVLEKGGSATDAVEKAINVLEDSPLFNAGKGAVLNSAGFAECDASIMDGVTLRAAGVGVVQRIKNPVSLARLVMDESPHVLLVGPGAEEFALSRGMPLVPNSYLVTPKKRESLQKRLEEERPYSRLEPSLPNRPIDYRAFGTVGAVALDRQGNLAAATSTGGREGKLPGRVGDSPIIGAGNYANNATCAVSCTGQGEYVLRRVTAYDISAMIEYRGMTLNEAVAAAKQKIVDMDAVVGIIAVNAKGEVAAQFSGNGMYRGVLRSGGEPEIGIYEQ